MDNKEIIKKYPFLLPRNVWTGEPFDDFDYSYNELEISIPEGWWKRWGIQYCEDFLNYLKKENIDPNEVYIEQAKEKYGGLRVYLNIFPKNWYEHEYAWEYISEHTCIRCGKFPVRLRDDGWISPYCDDCFRKAHPKSSEESLEKWTCDPNKGRMQEYLLYHIYKNGEEFDRTIDMKPYYKMIGWDFKQEDLISVNELI